MLFGKCHLSAWCGADTPVREFVNGGAGVLDRAGGAEGDGIRTQCDARPAQVQSLSPACLGVPGEARARTPAPTWLSGKRLEFGDFLGRELSEFSRMHIQLKRTVAYSLDLLHVVSNLFEHAPDLAILAFY